MSKKYIFVLILIFGVLTYPPDAYAEQRNKDEEACWQQCMIKNYQDKGLTERGKSCSTDCVGAGPITSPDDAMYKNFGSRTQCILDELDKTTDYSQSVAKCGAEETEKMVSKKYQAVCLPQCRSFRDGDALIYGRCLIKCDRDMVAKYGKATETLEGRADEYKERYINKCLEVYKNNPDAKPCCTDLAVADAVAMEKRGVFDTPTMAEIPIIIDEIKCKAPEYKYDCSLLNSSDKKEKDECRDYLNRCMESGRRIGYSEDTRKISCIDDYFSKKPLELDSRDKYIKSCLGFKMFKDSPDIEENTSKCSIMLHAFWQYYGHKCIMMQNEVDDTPLNSFIVRFRSIFNRTRYRNQEIECKNRFDRMIDKSYGNSQGKGAGR